VYRTLSFCEKFSCKLADHVFATNESYKAIEALARLPSLLYGTARI
jgi:hypothetical protein